MMTYAGSEISNRHQVVSTSVGTWRANLVLSKPAPEYDFPFTVFAVINAHPRLQSGIILLQVLRLKRHL